MCRALKQSNKNVFCSWPVGQQNKHCYGYFLAFARILAVVLCDIEDHEKDNPQMVRPDRPAE